MVPPYTSTYARTLVDDADAATARATLGLVIGTDVQAYDALLAALAGLDPNAGDVPYFPSAITMGSKPVSAYAWTLMAAANAAAAQTVLGVGALGDVTGAGMDNLFSSNGILTRTAAATYTSRTITGTSGQVTLTNGNGVAGNPTISLPARLSGVSKHLRFNVPEPNEWYDRDGEICIWPKTDAALTITNIELTCQINPAAQIDLDLKYADAFIGLANASVIHVLDTTAGVFSSGAETLAVPADKCVYLSWGARPASTITQIAVDITYDYD